MKNLIIVLMLLVAGSLVAKELNLIPPLISYQITSDIGYRETINGGGGDTLHKGIDMVSLGKRQDDVIRAVEAGVVTVHFPPPNGRFKGHPVYGALIVIDHGEGIMTLYAHMSRTWVREGQKIKKGEVIGRIGSTGMSTGPHLHFEILLDPKRYFTYSIQSKLMMEWN